MSRSIFHLVRKLEQLDNTSSYSEQLKQANYIFKTAVDAINAAVGDGPIAALLGVLERLCLSHPQPVELIQYISILLSKTELGLASQRDLERQFVYLKRGVELEDAFCTYMLGCSYYFGRGTSSNMKEAEVHFRKLYEKEIPCIESLRCNSGLGLSFTLMRTSDRTEQSIREAIAILLDIRHNESTITWAISELGYIFRFGLDDVPAEPETAWKIYEEALGLPDDGMFLHEMGSMAQNGEGLPEPNLLLADIYYTFSSMSGFSAAEDSLIALREFTGQTYST